MPNIPTHMSMALQAADKLAQPVVTNNLGSFALGCTSPDIRIITKWGRDRTHFAPLDIQRIGTGVDGLFEKNPAMANSSALNDATKAFLCGYINHLVADEAWILEMYHPYIVNSHAPSDHIQVNIWDRALQLEMDREAHEELDGLARVRGLLEEADEGVELSFIDAESLAEWRSWVSEFTTWEFSWERLRRLTRRMYGDDTQATDMVEQFLDNMPQSLEEVHHKIPQQRVQAYREKAVHESVRLVKEYLGVP